MKRKDFVAGMLAYMSKLGSEGHYSTAKSYRDALNSFKLFCGKGVIPYTLINKDTLLCYQAWLLGRGCSRNTVSTYMRRIRCICNQAMEAGWMPYIPLLFKGIFTGVESKRKKALPVEEMCSLIQVSVEDSALRQVQLAARLMFAFCGMAFVDFAHLRWENIQDGVLTYHRQKSGSLIRIEIPSEALPALEELAACTEKGSPFLFPFLRGKKCGEAAYREYQLALKMFNRDLRSLAEVVGINVPITSYSIRHTFAMALREQDVPIDVISELLGHKSIKTTQIYLKSFSLERLSAVNRACFGSVYKPIVGAGIGELLAE